METKIEKPKLKKVEMPKGESVKISSLVDQLGVPVHFLERPDPLSKWDTEAKYLPKLAVITGMVEHFNKEGMRVTYRTPKGVQGACYFPKDFPVRKLTGTIGKTLAKKFEHHALMNMAEVLQYQGAVGCDPEIFVENAKGCIPAFKFLGSKAKPTKTSGRAAGSKAMNAYWDGFQAEFETEANVCLAWNVDSVQDGLATVLRTAKKFDKDAKLSTKTVMEVPMNVLQESAEEHVEFGCMPSFNAYGLEGMKVPARQLTARSAGGHIHFGIGKRTPEGVSRIVKSLDSILGVSCVAMFANFDNPARRQFYGLPGEYRLPPHGLEYRTLSNAWLFHPLIMNLVFDLSRRCVALGDADMLKHFKGSDEETIEVIRMCDVERAKVIMDRNKGLIVELIKSSRGLYGSVGEEIFNVFRNGMETAVADPEDIAGNWKLEGGWVAHSDGVGKNVAHSVKALKGGVKVK